MNAKLRFTHVIHEVANRLHVATRQLERGQRTIDEVLHYFATGELEGPGRIDAKERSVIPRFVRPRLLEVAHTLLSVRSVTRSTHPMLPTVHEAFVSFAVENDADSEIPPWLERTSSDLPPASDGNVTFTFSSAISARENLANFAWFVASPRPKSSNSAGTAAVQAWLDTIHRPDFAALPDAIEREDSAEDESDERIRVVYVGGPGTWDHAFEDESNLVLVSRFSSLFKAARGLSADIDIVLINLDATQGTTDREATRFFEEIAQSHPHIRTIAWSRKTEAREKPSVADSITRIHAALFLQKPPSMEDLPTILHRVLADESPSASAEAAARPIPSQVQFSPREREILLLAARGLTTKEISRRMGLTTSLTYHILYRAREKMRAVTQTETGTSQHTH